MTRNEYRPPTSLPEWLAPFGGLGELLEAKKTPKGWTVELETLGGGRVRLVVPGSFEAMGSLATSLQRAGSILLEHRPQPKQTRIPGT